MQLSLLEKVIYVIPSILIAFVVHEIAHAYVAFLFGDPTAKYEGRFTIDPRKHLDPIGAGLILILIVIGSPIVFGWAKPVNVNPNNFRNPRQDMAWVAFAGPLSNFTMAAAAGMLIKFGLVGFSPILVKIIFLFVMVNLGLGIFNLIPVPPLDGSKIIYGLLPGNIAYRLMDVEARYAQYTPLILVVLIFSGALNVVIGVPYIFLLKIFTGI